MNNITSGAGSSIPSGPELRQSVLYITQNGIKYTGSGTEWLAIKDSSTCGGQIIDFLFCIFNLFAACGESLCEEITGKVPIILPDLAIGLSTQIGLVGES